MKIKLSKRGDMIIQLKWQEQTFKKMKKFKAFYNQIHNKRVVYQILININLK